MSILDTTTMGIHPVKKVKHPIPWNMSRMHPWPWLVIASGDITPHIPTGLYCRYMVFKNVRDMRKVVKHIFRNKWSTFRGVITNSTGGICIDTTTRIWENGVIVYREIEPKIFAFILLVKNNVTPEVIAHESIHAGFAFHRRAQIEWPGKTKNEEENICYPAGRIAGHLTTAMQDQGLLVIPPP